MKTCKKLFSLLLVAVMLIAAVPTFAFADGEDVQAVKDYKVVVKLENGNTVNGTTTASVSDSQKVKSDYGTLINAMKAAGLDAYTDSSENGYTITKVSVDEDTDTITVEVKSNKVAEPAAPEYTVTVVGDASAVGPNKLDKIDADTVSDYGKLSSVMTAAGLSQYMDSSKWTITKVQLNDKVLNVTVEKVAQTHTHDYKWDGKVGDANGHTLVCKVDGCTEATKIEAHTFGTDGKCTVCGYEKPKADVTYTGLKIVVNGKTDTTSTKSFVYNGTVDGAHAADIFKAAGITKSLDGYTVTAAVEGTQIVVTLTSTSTSNPTKVTVSVINGSETKTYELEVGKYYYDYDFFTFANQDGRKFAALKVTDNAGYDRILSAGVKNDSAKVRSNDVKVTVQWNADVRVIEFMTDSTLSKVGTSRELYYGARLDSVGGTLPTTVGGKTVEYWTVWGSRIYDNTEYKWNADKVQAVPHFAGETGKVYLEIYVNGNRTAKYSQLDITYLLQDGVIYRDRLTSAIESAVKTKNVKITGLFEESDWSSYVRNVNNVTNKTSVQIGTNNDTARYLYVMVNGVSTKTSDSTNPKTGDNVKLGVAAAVLAVAVVGFGAVVVVNKKKGVQ